MQVLKAPSKDGSTRVGDVTLRRERCLVDALQRQMFMRVSAIRGLFRVRTQHGLGNMCRSIKDVVSSGRSTPCISVHLCLSLAILLNCALTSRSLWEVTKRACCVG